ncbi:TPA: sel1 repeat family protein [Pseudomonas aeruginosa]|jgi:TPR repeat protein|uniref:tetratricopeptide repeat protein n=1 Tax=Pseudomonas aeruginosa TaxID=287 RepID=UPI000373EE86|nr:sel1 repeat family protein [Pseudomonas aeruginosa]KSR46979.1 hypothetical protein APB53_05875 [Pseudomonas aeruginosa]RPV08546.1 sel1 repeat family protein [Pseudomonas aeruginosa]WPB12553.1 hypothetical protein XM8_contig2_00119 [Pseudomonas aeruginosa]HBP5649095.1 sel1 repeat family protein [Pseudomonas aeruginosa]HBP5921581.1 sel1 repeat family protein [Pseudomonas aeruginosa]
MIGNTNLSRAVDTKSRETLLRLASLTRDLSSNDDRCRGNAYRDLLELAEEGSSDAMFQVARCLNQGIGVEVDQVKSDHWLRLACVTTPPSKVALYSFGMQNLLRKRPDADPMLGLNLIERAATAGYVTAILELVKLLENGTADIVPDLRRAYRLLAGAITDHSDMKLHEAYLSFVERNQPLSTLLDS